MILNNKSTGNYLYVADHFFNSKKISESKELNKVFEKVKWFKTRNEAIYVAATKKPKTVYIDSDVGLNPLIRLCILKLRSKKTKIHVYEEGIGTYRTDLINNKIKKTIYNIVGAGCYFGGAFITDKIHVFNVDLYKKNIPFLSYKVISITPPFETWLKENKQKLINIFCQGFKIEETTDTKIASLYLTDWSIDMKTVKEVPKSSRLFLKPHPHIKKEVIDKLPNDRDIEIVPSEIPAEILINILLEKFSKVNVYHKNSSALTYLNDSRIISTII